MDEEISIIDTKTRSEKIKNFFIDNRKLLISIVITIIFILIFFYSYQTYNDKKKEQISERYNNAIIEYNKKNNSKTQLIMKEIIEDEDTTYSPLALYFLIDNDLIENRKDANKFFDILINKTSLDKEIKNLIIYKKALYNADILDENELIQILKPVLNSESIWKSHSLYLVAEYFYSKNEIQKSKDFFYQIINTENANLDIIKEAQKRLNRDLSE
tara:strand:- start:186 stop:830 length:645 start_codon:yes stop_codon:yes gene_type:complete